MQHDDAPLIASHRLQMTRERESAGLILALEAERAEVERDLHRLGSDEQDEALASESQETNIISVSEELRLRGESSEESGPQGVLSEEDDQCSEDGGLQAMESEGSERQAIGAEDEEPAVLGLEGEEGGRISAEDDRLQGLEETDDPGQVVHVLRNKGIGPEENQDSEVVSPEADRDGFRPADDDDIGERQGLDYDERRRQGFESDEKRCEGGDLRESDPLGLGHVRNDVSGIESEERGLASAAEEFQSSARTDEICAASDAEHLKAPSFLQSSVLGADLPSDRPVDDDIGPEPANYHDPSAPLKFKTNIGFVSDPLDSSLGIELLRSYEGDEDPEALVARAYNVGQNLY